MSDFRRHLERLLQDPKFAAEYKESEAQYAFAKQVIHARAMLEMTQNGLALKAGTTQANISKIENADMNPTIEMMSRIAKALGMQLQIKLVEEFLEISKKPDTSNLSLFCKKQLDKDDEENEGINNPQLLQFVA